MAISREVHFNCDVAEGIGNEAQLLPYLSACNIACGAHAGNDALIVQTVQLAINHHVEIGAHPGFPDPDNFGRKEMNIDLEVLRTSLSDQILKVKTITEDMGGTLYHVKPHGALYNCAAKDITYANLVVEVVQEIDTQLILYVPYKSIISKMAQGKLNTVIEGFADRRYTDSYALASRDLEQAVISMPEAVFDQVKMIRSGQIKTLSKNIIPFKAETLCVHGDTPNAIDILKYVVGQLNIEKFDA